MQESLLHYLWQFQYFDARQLTTTTGEPIAILHPGYRNTDAGPDFSSARLKLNDIEWIGHVEIHIHASGWIAHKHHHDGAYENVILHVVWENDVPIKRRDGSWIPTLELRGRVTKELLEKYNALYLNPETIPCSNSIHTIPEIVKAQMVEKAAIGRLEAKANHVRRLFEINHNDWQETAYQMIARNFGFKVNGDPFFMLAKSLPFKLLLKHIDKPIQLEALLFGHAGFLEDDYGDEYYALLKREFKLLNQKYSLLERRLNKSQWKLLRLRPANFPTMRLAQFAAFIGKEPSFFAKRRDLSSYAELVDLFSVTQSAYWRDHYLFSKKVEEVIPGLGRMSVDNMIINTAIPLLIAYGRVTDDQIVVDKAIGILEAVPSEDNMIIKRWASLNITSGSAADSQGLIELYNNFCLRKRCLDCNIGSALVKPVIHEFS